MHTSMLFKSKKMSGLHRKESELCIKIDFERNSQNPQRVFNSMSHIISSVEEFHSCLLNSVSAETKSKFILSDINEGSIKSWLCPEIEGDVTEEKKRRLTSFLTYCTDLVISFISDKDTIESLEVFAQLEDDIATAAEEFDVEEFPNVFSLDRYRLLKGYTELSQSTSDLNSVDEVYLYSQGTTKKINKNFHLTKEAVEAILIEKVVNNTKTETLVIKKADFIGKSMWDFLRKKSTISARITHQEWLDKFHSRTEIVAPGDGLLCDLVTKAYFDRSNNLIDTKYEVILVHKKVDVLNLQKEFKYDS
ncbi:hypothetical protein CLV44_101252 [Marinobacterium halophilum]|uniref:Uncharacterized protein n=1 Tax=Marinobacterium halophilum TaxID=267374 RepID=A0A2P8F575_9GAMM|nr:hypothetical protein [Marinobacterium halophilum]PSL16852.1 hypothetical protein CLV44_101252 [Marinobacterium halophilum]